jgi:hypothetical protein
MYFIDDVPIAPWTGFTHNGSTFPANWNVLFTAEDKAQYNITEVPDPEPYNEQFYYAAGIPKELGMVKEVLIRQIKESTNNSLMPTSWMIERFNDPSSGKPVPQNVLDYRANLRTLSNTFEEAINAATSIEELAAIQFQFPEPL